jgi:hypothetical protein
MGGYFFESLSGIRRPDCDLLCCRGNLLHKSKNNVVYLLAIKAYEGGNKAPFALNLAVDGVECLASRYSSLAPGLTKQNNIWSTESVSRTGRRKKIPATCWETKDSSVFQQVI